MQETSAIQDMQKETQANTKEHITKHIIER
jgi:hypothetical protein